MWSIILESRILRIKWLFTEFIKNLHDSDDSIDLIFSIRRLIISVISSVINDLFSILSSLQDNLLLNWSSCFFLIRYICF
jgi:hypothetical protein